MTRSPQVPTDTLRARAVEGTLWSGIAQVGGQLAGIASTAVLARLLLPSDFGILGMALIFIGLGQQINELGLSAAMVQRKDLRPDHVSTSFWLTVGMACVLALGIVVASPWIAALFHEPRLVGVLRLISLDFVLASLAMVPRALLQRDLRFRGIALGQMAGALGYGITATAVALLGGGVYALVAGQLAITTAMNLVVWRVCPWRPSFEFSFERFRELKRFGLHMLGANLLNYSGANVDFFLVGRFLGSGPLGIYTMAYNLATVPQKRIARLLLSVLFPAFSRIQDEPARLKEAFLRSQRLLAALVFPALFGLAFVATDFVDVLLGDKWVDSVLPIRILCAAGIAYAMASSVSSFLLSRGRSDLLMWFGLVRLVVISAAVMIGIRFGIVGASWGVTLYALFFWIVFQHVINRVSSLSMREYLGALAPGFLASLGMTGFLAGISLVPGASAIPSAVRLALQIVLGASAYLLLLRTFFPATWSEGLSIGRSFVIGIRAPFRGSRSRRARAGEPEALAAKPLPAEIPADPIDGPRGGV